MALLHGSAHGSWHGEPHGWWPWRACSSWPRRHEIRRLGPRLAKSWADLLVGLAASRLARLVSWSKAWVVGILVLADESKIWCAMEVGHFHWASMAWVREPSLDHQPLLTVTSYQSLPNGWTNSDIVIAWSSIGFLRFFVLVIIPAPPGPRNHVHSSSYIGLLTK